MSTPDGTVTLDRAVFALFTAVLAAALLAGYLPARRATRVDPAVALHRIGTPGARRMLTNEPALRNTNGATKVNAAG